RKKFGVRVLGSKMEGDARSTSELGDLRERFPAVLARQPAVLGNLLGNREQRSPEFGEEGGSVGEVLDALVGHCAVAAARDGDGISDSRSEVVGFGGDAERGSVPVAEFDARRVYEDQLG